MKRYFIIMKSEEVDTAYFLQLAFARATSLLLLILSFFVISFVTSACLLFLGVEPKKGAVKSVQCLFSQSIILFQVRNLGIRK